MAHPGTIAVVTGTRAEFGLLEPVMRAIGGHEALSLRVIVSGAHLVANTIEDVAHAGFTIDATVPMQRRGESGRWPDSRALGRGITGFAQTLASDAPELVLVLGDRIEAFAAAIAASVGGIHVAHLHGGDRAEGVADESMRHAISKLAHLHLPATAASRRRLIRMGEHPEQIHVVGSPAIDGLDAVTPAIGGPELILVYHPVGDTDAHEKRRMEALLEASSAYDRLILAPNHDPGRTGMIQALHGQSVTDHLPRRRFLEQLAGAKAVVGNSSAGLIEAAALGTACVNLGNRQGGRDKPANVVDCPDDLHPEAIHKAIVSALACDLTHLEHPYGSGQTGERIASLIARMDLADIPLRKQNRY